MPDERTSYQQTRDAFERLGTGDQATFALEALFTAGGALVQEAGRQAASAIREVERTVDEAFRTAPDRADEPGATPETPSP